MTAAVRDTTRWNLAISRETDIAVRSFLARSGFRKGDLSRFVEEAVRWRVFDQTLREAREGFSDLGEDEGMTLLDEALAGIRAEMREEGRSAADTSGKP